MWLPILSNLAVGLANLIDWNIFWHWNYFSEHLHAVLSKYLFFMLLSLSGVGIAGAAAWYLVRPRTLALEISGAAQSIIMLGLTVSMILLPVFIFGTYFYAWLAEAYADFSWHCFAVCL